MSFPKLSALLHPIPLLVRRSVQLVSAPELEKLGILGVTDKTRRRPGDVAIKSWSFRRGLAFDVAVICPLAASHLGKAEPCESYSQHQKIDRYADAFVHSDYDFAPVIFETSSRLFDSPQSVRESPT